MVSNDKKGIHVAFIMPQIHIFCFPSIGFLFKSDSKSKSHNSWSEAAVSSHIKKKRFFFKRVCWQEPESQSVFPSPQSQILIHTFQFVKQFWRRMMSPGIIVIANPDIIELQSDRVTPGAARTITLRPGSQWKSCIRVKPQSIRCWKTGKCWQIMCQYQPK